MKPRESPKNTTTNNSTVPPDFTQRPRIHPQDYSNGYQADPRNDRYEPIAPECAFLGKGIPQARFVRGIRERVKRGIYTRTHWRDCITAGQEVNGASFTRCKFRDTRVTPQGTGEWGRFHAF